MKQWQKPQIVFHGAVADLTKGKMNAGTDAFSGSYVLPGGCGSGGNDPGSHDAIIKKW